MTPLALKNLIEACVQALSDNRTGTGDYALNFIYGRVEEAYLQKLEEKNVQGLRNAVVFMEYRPFQSQDMSAGSNQHKVRMHFLKSHKEDNRSAANLEIQTEMYNLWIDFLKVLRGENTTNLSQTNKNLLNYLTIEPVSWQMFDRVSNVTAGVLIDLEITSLYCTI